MIAAVAELSRVSPHSPHSTITISAITQNTFNDPSNHIMVDAIAERISKRSQRSYVTHAYNRNLKSYVLTFKQLYSISGSLPTFHCGLCILHCLSNITTFQHKSVSMRMYIQWSSLLYVVCVCTCINLSIEKPVTGNILSLKNIYSTKKDFIIMVLICHILQYIPLTSITTINFFLVCSQAKEFCGHSKCK